MVRGLVFSLLPRPPHGVPPNALGSLAGAASARVAQEVSSREASVSPEAGLVC